MKRHCCTICGARKSQAKGRPCTDCRDDQLEKNRHNRRVVGYGLPYGHIDQRQVPGKALMEKELW